MRIGKRKQEEAIERAEGMGRNYTSSDVKKVESRLSLMRRGPVARIWDKVMLLWKAFNSKDTPASLKATLIGCLVYLVSPIDIIPDMVIGIGLLDDVAVLVWGCSLLEKLQKTEIGKKVAEVTGQVVGVVSGGVVGGVAGMAVGSVVGKSIADHGLEGTSQLVKDKISQLVVPLATHLMHAKMEESFRRMLSNTFFNFILFQFSLLLLVSPVFGPVASGYVSSFLLLFSLVLGIFRCIRGSRKVILVLVDCGKKKSLSKGIAAYLRKMLTLLLCSQKELEALPGIDTLIEKFPLEALVRKAKRYYLLDFPLCLA